MVHAARLPPRTTHERGWQWGLFGLSGKIQQPWRLNQGPRVQTCVWCTLHIHSPLINKVFTTCFRFSTHMYIYMYISVCVCKYQYIYCQGAGGKFCGQGPMKTPHRSCANVPGGAHGRCCAPLRCHNGIVSLLVFTPKACRDYTSVVEFWK